MFVYLTCVLKAMKIALVLLGHKSKLFSEVKWVWARENICYFDKRCYMKNVCFLFFSYFLFWRFTLQYLPIAICALYIQIHIKNNTYMYGNNMTYILHGNDFELFGFLQNGVTYNRKTSIFTKTALFIIVSIWLKNKNKYQWNVLMQSFSVLTYSWLKVSNLRNWSQTCNMYTDTQYILVLAIFSID